MNRKTDLIIWAAVTIPLSAVAVAGTMFFIWGYEFIGLSWEFHPVLSPLLMGVCMIPLALGVKLDIAGKIIERMDR